MQAPRKIICIHYNPAHSQLFTESGIFSTQERVACPVDSLDRFRRLDFHAMLFET